MPESQAQQAVLLVVSEALAKVTARLRGRAEAARDFDGLTGRAQAIAAAARQLQTSRWEAAENAAKLADDLVGFAADVGAAAARAVQEAEGNMATVEALNAQAGRLKALGLPEAAGGGQGDPGDALRQLEATLVVLQGRTAQASGASGDAALLASRASELAACAGGLADGGRGMEETAARLGKALAAFAQAARSVSARLSNVPAVQDAAARAAFTAMEAELAAVRTEPNPGRRNAMGWF